jgi:hypothetical protein
MMQKIISCAPSRPMSSSVTKKSLVFMARTDPTAIYVSVDIYLIITTSNVKFTINEQFC